MFINKHLLSFCRGEKNRILRTCLMQILLTAFGTGTALCTAFVVRMLRGEGKILFFRSIPQVFCAILVLFLLRFVFTKRRAAVSEQCGLAVKTVIREQLLRKLFALGPASAGEERTGEIASVISSKVDYLTEYYTVYLPQAAAALVNAAWILPLTARFDPVTALVCFCGAAGMTVTPMLFYFLMRRRGDAEMRAYSAYYSDCLDSLQGMTALKAFNAGERQKKVIHDKGEELRAAVMGHLRITMLENVVLQLFAGTGSAISVAAAAYRCAGGYTDSDGLVYLLFLIGAVFSPLTALINAWHLGYRGVVASYSIASLLSAREKHHLSAHGRQDSAERSSGSAVRFEHVSFAYSAEEGDVLHDVSFEIMKGTTTAITGASGSGKSTVAHILAGFYPVERGAVYVDGELLSEETVSDVQDKIAAVWQDSRIFFGTVEDNIRIGRPDAPAEAVAEAAENAGIHELIAGLPEGYQTNPGEMGLRFSGGERQRIALARAFLRDAPIVILDEATSSLDMRTEQEIQESFRKLMKGKTALVIAHRLATIRSADRIILMENGRIEDQGTHEELLARSRRYRKLMGSQSAEAGVNET